MSNLSKVKRERMLKFLSCLKEKNSDDDAALMAINEIENFVQEKKFGLIWERHDEKVDEILRSKLPVFRESKERMITTNELDGFNFLLEGDNLYTLKLLQKTHSNRVDVIYIDPPYNKGNKDFRYNDKFVDKDDSFQHSKWLSFMEERLSLAKNLLKKDGAIFISIDDKEYAPLKLLCDSLFGESNFIATVVVTSNSSKNHAKQISVNHEYLVCYALDKTSIKEEWKVQKNQIKSFESKAKQLLKKKLNSSEIHEELLSLVKYPRYYDFDHFTYADEGGVYQSGDAGGVKNGNTKTIVKHPITQKPCAIPNGGWRYKESVMETLVANNGLVFGEDETIIPRVKRYLHDNQTQVPKSVCFFDSQSTTKWLKSHNIKFDYPKALEFIMHVLSMPQKKDAVVLDFFAGTGTTGHAVVKLNARDGGTRKYILCTNNEQNICEEVTYKRLKLVQEQHPHNLKYFKTELVQKSEDLPDHLYDYIVPLVELENMVSIEGERCAYVDDESCLEATIKRMSVNGRLYLADYVFVNENCLQLIEEKSLTCITVPQYYFESEIAETESFGFLFEEEAD